MIQSDVVTTLMPSSSRVQNRSTSGHTPLKLTTSGFDPEDVVDVAGGCDPERAHPDDLSGVAPDLLGRIAVEADQLEVGVVDDPLDHLRAHVPGGELHDPERLFRQGAFSPSRHEITATARASYGGVGHLSRRVSDLASTQVRLAAARA